MPNDESLFTDPLADNHPKITDQILPAAIKQSATNP